MNLLILENNQKPKGASHRITLESMRSALESRGIQLEAVLPDSERNILKEDLYYVGQTPPTYPQWNICLRTIYVPPEYGVDLFTDKLRAVIKTSRPDCILTHLALYGRAGRFRDYPVIKALLPYAQKGTIRIIVYTGTADDGLSLSADTDGSIEFFYNNRKIDTQIDYILELLKSGT